MRIEFISIGVVNKSVENKKDTNWGNDLSEIIIDEQGLIGLLEFII